VAEVIDDGIKFLSDLAAQKYAGAVGEDRGPGDGRWRVGSECVGIGGSYMAIEGLGVSDKFHHVFASEKDDKTRAVFEQNFEVDIMYGDITTRDQHTTPAVDIYTAGFPCQGISSAGCGGGLADIRTLVLFNWALPNCNNYSGNQKVLCITVYTLETLYKSKTLYYRIRPFKGPYTCL